MGALDCNETCPLPDDPVLAATAAALEATGQWAEIFDSAWNGVYLTDDARRMYGGRVELAPYTVGLFMFGPERIAEMTAWRGGLFPTEVVGHAARMFLPWMLADAGPGREGLRGRVDPRLHDILDLLEPVVPAAAWSYVFPGIYTSAGAGVEIRTMFLRLRDDSGAIVGTAQINKPAIGMAMLARMTALGDRRHFARL